MCKQIIKLHILIATLFFEMLADSEIEKFKMAGKDAATILLELSEHIQPGITTAALNALAGEFMTKMNVRSAPQIDYGFPAYICASLYPVIAHGLPNYKRAVDGDLLNIDVAIEKDGYYADVGYTFLIGDGHEYLQRLLSTGKAALKKAIEVCAPGKPLNEVGNAMETTAREAGFTIVRNLCSHGLGKSLHAHPGNILNYYDPEQDLCLEQGMVVALEPYLSTQACMARKTADEWSYTTHNKSHVAQFEHSILITESGAEVLTSL